VLSSPTFRPLLTYVARALPLQTDSHTIAHTHFYNQKQIILLSITIAITVAVTMSKSKAPEYPEFNT
jgi:hypothetical protein